MNKIFACKVLESKNFAWTVLKSVYFARIVLFKLLIYANPLVQSRQIPKHILGKSQHYHCIFFLIHLI